MKKVDSHNFFWLYIKWLKKPIIKRTKKSRNNNKKAKEFSENNKKILKEKSRNKYRELSEEEKNIKSEYWRNRYNNIPEEKKQRLKQYQKETKIATLKFKIKNIIFFSLHSIKNETKIIDFR